jgi:hypothetical protein
MEPNYRNTFHREGAKDAKDVISQSFLRALRVFAVEMPFS